MFEDNFVLVQIVTNESKDKKALENPGWEKLIETWGGAKAGLPFFVILNGKGEKITDSNRMPGGKNIGCPASAAEIVEFDKILQQTAPLITETQRAQLAAHFNKLNEKQ